MCVSGPCIIDHLLFENFVCMYGCVVYMCDICTHVSRTLEAKEGIRSPALLTLYFIPLRHHLSLNLARLAVSKSLPSSCLSLDSADVKKWMTTHPAFYTGTGDLNSDPHAWAASALNCLAVSPTHFLNTLVTKSKTNRLSQERRTERTADTHRERQEREQRGGRPRLHFLFPIDSFPGSLLVPILPGDSRHPCSFFLVFGFTATLYCGWLAMLGEKSVTELHPQAL